MRAIILCAGMATRLTPLSLYTHKALLPIKGRPLIEHTIEYLQSHGVIDITLVLGYKAEDFFYLQKKYGVDYRISEKWRTHNNYSSMQLVFDKFKDVLVIDGDLHIVEDFICLAPSCCSIRNESFCLSVILSGLGVVALALSL